MFIKMAIKFVCRTFLFTFLKRLLNSLSGDIKCNFFPKMDILIALIFYFNILLIPIFYDSKFEVVMASSRS